MNRAKFEMEDMVQSAIFQLCDGDAGWVAQHGGTQGLQEVNQF